eukprot:423182_1
MVVAPIPQANPNISPTNHSLAPLLTVGKNQTPNVPTPNGDEDSITPDGGAKGTLGGGTSRGKHTLGGGTSCGKGTLGGGSGALTVQQVIQNISSSTLGNDGDDMKDPTDDNNGTQGNNHGYNDVSNRRKNDRSNKGNGKRNNNRNNKGSNSLNGA